MPDHEVPELGSIPLMHQLSEMANIPLALCRRMVLVLDVADMPRLFIETFLNAEKPDVPLVKTELVVSNEPIIVDTTTLQNNVYCTHAVVGVKK